MSNKDDLVKTLRECRTTSFLGLGEQARTEYLKVCRFMIAHGTLKTCDLPVVASYAQAQVDVREAQKEIDRLGLVITGTVDDQGASGGCSGQCDQCGGCR